jgi:transposase
MRGTQNQAIGRSSGGLTTKIGALVDALGNLIAFVLVPGQRHDVNLVDKLMNGVACGAFLGDKAFDANKVRELLARNGAEAVILPRKGTKGADSYEREKYKWRHLIEKFFCSDLEFVLCQFGDHLTGPQRESELHLQRILLRHGVKDPPQRPPIQFRRTPEQRLRLQGAPAAAPVLRQPSVNRRPVQPKNAGYRFWAFTLLDLTHRAFAQFFQRLMTQPACIVFSHTGGESLNICTVNKKSTYL